MSIHSSFLPPDDPDAAPAFSRDALGIEVRNDVGYNGRRWITIGPTDQPGTSIVLYPPAAEPGVSHDERCTIAEVMAEGAHARVLGRAGPTYGVRDCALRAPRAT